MIKKFFKNSSGHWASIVLLFAAGLFAAGKTYESHADLCRKVDQKVDRKLYEVERKHLDQQLQRIIETLEHLEEKFDAIILGEHKANSANSRNPEPIDPI